MNAQHYQQAINLAQLNGLPHLAVAILGLYRAAYPEDFAESFEEFCAAKDREQAAEDEQREVEASQLADWHHWKRQ